MVSFAARLFVCLGFSAYLFSHAHATDKPLKTKAVSATPSSNSSNTNAPYYIKPPESRDSSHSIPDQKQRPSHQNAVQNSQKGSGEIIASSNFAQTTNADSNQKKTSKGLKPIEYDLTLKQADNDTDGKLPSEITDDFQKNSLLVSLKDRPLYSKFALNKRITTDKEALKTILFFYGYYDVSIKTDIMSPNAVRTKTTVMFDVTLGNRYKIKTLRTQFTRPTKDPEPCLIHPKDYDVDLGKPFTADDVLGTFADIKTNLATCGYPFANIVSHKAILDRNTKTIAVHLTIDQGPFVRFGVTNVKTSKAVPKSFIKNRSPLEPGEPYNQDKVNEYQDKLSTTKLFKGIKIERSKKEEDIKDGEAVDVDVSVEEGPPRTITAGVKYGTGEGIGVDFSWLHRNMFGKADTFKVETHIAQNERSAGLTYELPDFLKVDQTLKLNFDYTVEKRDAFRANGFGVSAVLRNELPNDWYYFYGLSYENTAIEERDMRMRVGAFGVPLGIGLNRVNDTLNPTNGYKFDLTITPEYGNIGNASTIVRSLLYAVYHVPLDDLERNTVSFWSRLGLLFGGDAASLPANRRFFGGGGGSVRGYARDFLSPVDNNGKPLGGKSLFEFGIEPRFRFNKNWGVVCFIEGGVINDKTYPSFNENLLFGAGFGVRYYTDFGPIRADIAFPLKRREDQNGQKVDGAIQFYISIGQAF